MASQARIEPIPTKAGPKNYAAEVVGTGASGLAVVADTPPPTHGVGGLTAKPRPTHGPGPVMGSKKLKPDGADLPVPGARGIEPVPGYAPVGQARPQQAESAMDPQDDWRPVDAAFAGGSEASETAAYMLPLLMAPATEVPDGHAEALERRGWRPGSFIRSVRKHGGIGRGGIIGAIGAGVGRVTSGGRFFESAAAVDGLAEVVIGVDDRVLVPETTAAPWSGICQLNIEAENGRGYVGTGWLIAPRTVVTAGHCVYMHDAGGWARRITVAAGRNGSERPFGAIESDDFQAPAGWIESQTREEDFGVIFLPEAFPAFEGAAPHLFEFTAPGDAELLGQVLNISGYAADDPWTGKDSTLQWFHARAILRVQDQVVHYDIDTGGGDSGAPCWFRDPATGRRQVVAIHTNGHTAGNSATRITPAMLQTLEQWRAAGA